MKIFAIVLLLMGIFNIAMGSSIVFSDFKPTKNNSGLVYVSLGIFMIDGFLRFIK